jgi:hypothetical protein
MFGCPVGLVGQNLVSTGVSARMFGTPREGDGTGLLLIILGSKTHRLLLERADVPQKTHQTTKSLLGTLWACRWRCK